MQLATAVRDYAAQDTQAGTERVRELRGDYRPQADRGASAEHT